MENKYIRLLLVEDNKIDQIAFERFVKQKGLYYEYVVVSSINEAKQSVETQLFDIVVLDFLLEDGTAFELLDSLKGLPTIVVTGPDDAEIAVKAD